MFEGLAGGEPPVRTTVFGFEQIIPPTIAQVVSRSPQPRYCRPTSLLRNCPNRRADHSSKGRMVSAASKTSSRAMFSAERCDLVAPCTNSPTLIAVTASSSSGETHVRKIELGAQNCHTMITVQDFHRSIVGREVLPCLSSAILSTRFARSASSCHNPKAAIAGCSSRRSTFSRVSRFCPSASARRKAASAARSNRSRSLEPVRRLQDVACVE